MDAFLSHWRSLSLNITSSPIVLCDFYCIPAHQPCTLFFLTISSGFFSGIVSHYLWMQVFLHTVVHISYSLDMIRNVFFPLCAILLLPFHVSVLYSTLRFILPHYTTSATESTTSIIFMHDRSFGLIFLWLQLLSANQTAHFILRINITIHRSLTITRPTFCLRHIFFL